MAHIRKVTTRRGTAYEVRWSWYTAEGARRFGKRRHTTLTAAREHARSTEAAIADGAPTDDRTTRRLTVAHFAAEFLRRKEVNGRKPRTINGYRSLLDAHITPTFGHRRVRSVTTADVQSFVLDLASKGLHPLTVRHAYQVLKQVLDTAARSGAIPSNPGVGVELPSRRNTPPFQPTFLTPPEVELLAAYLDTEQRETPYGLLIRFMAYTGLRAGEVAGLNVGDIDIGHSRVHVLRTRSHPNADTSTTKSGRDRYVPLPPWLAEDLAAFLAEKHPYGHLGSAPLWPGRRVGGYSHGQSARANDPTAKPGAITYDAPWDRDAFYRRVFKPALTAAGLPQTTRLHDLRHTYASICASANIPAYRVAAYMGHASEIVTRTIYTHLFREDATDDMTRLARPSATRDNVVRLRDAR